MQDLKKIHSSVDTIGVHMAGCLQVKPCCTHPPFDKTKNNKGNKKKNVKASQITQNRHFLKSSYWNGKKCSGTCGVSPPGKRLGRIRYRLYCPRDWGPLEHRRCWSFQWGPPWCGEKQGRKWGWLCWVRPWPTSMRDGLHRHSLGHWVQMGPCVGRRLCQFLSRKQTLGPVHKLI